MNFRNRANCEVSSLKLNITGMFFKSARNFKAFFSFIGAYIWCQNPYHPEFAAV